MKNSEMPIMPCSAPDKGAREELLRALKETGEFTVPEIKDIANKMSRHGGLTKREYFAATMNHDTEQFAFGDISQAEEFLGRGIDTDSVGDIMLASIQVDAKFRVMRADALLAELEKES